MKLRYKVPGLFVTTSLAVFVVVAVFSYGFITKNSHMMMNRYLDAKTAEVSERLDKWLTMQGTYVMDLQQFLKYAKNYQNIKGRDLGNMNEHKSFSDIYIGWEDGSFINSRKWIPPKGYDPRKRPWYVEVKRAGQLHFSKPYFDLLMKQYAISIGVPMKSADGKLLGIIAVDVPLKNLLNEVENIKLGMPGYGLLIDQDGTALYHPDRQLINKNLLQNRETKKIATYMIHRKNGRLQYELSKESKMIFFNRIPSASWYLGIVIDQNTAFSAVYQLRNRFILSIIGMIILMMLLALYFSGKLTKSITQLNENAKKIAGGNFYNRIRIRGSDELAELSEAFNHMADELEQLVGQLESEKKNAELNAITDSLTGLTNRRYFDEILEREFYRTKRTGEKMTLIMLDVDYYKLYNDTYGHVAGDECLRKVAEVIRSIVKRTPDIASRYGGEEFMIILPGTETTGGLQVAENIRSAIEQLKIPHSASKASGFVTASLGVATIAGAGIETPEKAVELVDKAMYAAKQRGRNCVSIAES